MEDRKEIHKLVQNRDRSPKETPDDPVLVDKEVKIYNDNHTHFSWEARRLYKQPNRESEIYWKETQYVTEIRPNLREGLVFTHLVPMSLSPKVLVWVHNVKANLNMSYFMHSQTNTKKKRRNVQVSATNDGVRSSTMNIGQPGMEANGVAELMVAVHNYTAMAMGLVGYTSG